MEECIITSVQSQVVFWWDLIQLSVMEILGMIQLLLVLVSREDNVPSWHRATSGPLASPHLSLEVANHGHDSPTAEVLSGEEVTILCEARGGNPDSVLSLYKNGSPLGSPTTGQVNTFTMVVEPQDNTAVITCSARNEAMQEPVESSLVVNVICKYIENILDISYYCCY